jgi:hypothetical protein
MNAIQFEYYFSAVACGWCGGMDFRESRIFDESRFHL